jgi:hypothetical protein
MVMPVQYRNGLQMAQQVAYVLAPAAISIALRVKPYFSSRIKGAVCSPVTTFLLTALACKRNGWSWGTNLVTSLTLTYIASKFFKPALGPPPIAHQPLPFSALRDRLLEADTPSLVGAYKETRYRSLQQDDRRAVRGDLYQALFPLIKEAPGPVEIPCMTGYRGESVFLSREGDWLTMTLRRERGSYVAIGINQTGSVRFCYGGLKMTYSTITNATTHEILFQANEPEPNVVQHHTFVQNGCTYAFRYVENEELFLTIENENLGDRLILGEDTVEHVPEGGCSQILIPDRDLTTGQESPKVFINNVEAEFNYSMACMELLVYKKDQIASFLGSGQDWQAKIFEAARALLNVPSQVAGLTGAVSYVIGPMWNSVVASENSYFKWIISRDPLGEVSLHLESNSHLYDVTLKAGCNPTDLEVAISLGHSGATSKYWLSYASGQGVQIRPLGRTTSQSWYPPFGSMHPCEQDINCIREALTTFADLQLSTETLFMDLANRCIYDRRGTSLSVGELKYILLSHKQGVAGSDVLRPMEAQDAIQVNLHLDGQFIVGKKESMG